MREINEIELIPIESPIIEAIGYDTKKELLAVRLKSGETYHYHFVDDEQFLEFNRRLGHSNPTQYLHENHQFERIV